MARSILIAEDERSLRLLMVRILSARGYRVLEAVNGREALDILNRERVALVLLDLAMPVLSGWEFLREVRADPALAQLPVIVVSAAEEAPEGASAHVGKPFHIQSLLSEVERLAHD